MNFRKLPKEKRQHLILVVVITLAAMSGLGYGLIRNQYSNLGQLAEKRVEAEKKLSAMQDKIKKADQVQSQLQDAAQSLEKLEAGIASTEGYYSWIINVVREFVKNGYKVDLPTFGQSATLAKMNMIPGFPYEQATLSVAGSAYYHDLGKFIADFENAFPHIRITNLDIELSPTATGPDREKLAFKMDIVVLVKPNVK